MCAVQVFSSMCSQNESRCFPLEKASLDVVGSGEGSFPRRARIYSSPKEANCSTSLKQIKTGAWEWIDLGLEGSVRI